jgi:hypothetical protein
MTRPVKVADKKRSAHIAFRCTAEDERVIRSLAKEHGLPCSDFIRAACFGQVRVKRQLVGRIRRSAAEPVVRKQSRPRKESAGSGCKPGSLRPAVADRPAVPVSVELVQPVPSSLVVSTPSDSSTLMWDWDNMCYR